MGRGQDSSRGHINNPRQLLFGPRRLYGASDPAKVVAAALASLDQGHDGQAIVALRRYQEKIGSDAHVDSLLGRVIEKSLDDLFTDEEIKAVYHFRLSPDLEPMVLDEEVKAREAEYLINRLGKSLKEQLAGDEQKVSLDSDEVVAAALAAPVIGSVSNRLIGSMSQQQRIDWAYKLRGSKSVSAQFLENNIVYSLVAIAERDARTLASDFAFTSVWSEKVTYFRRGGYGKATLLHLLDESGRATLCGKGIKRYAPKPVRRGCWRDARPRSDYKRCAKCEKLMSEDFFGPAEDDENYSLLDRQSYDSLVRRSRREVRRLFAAGSPSEDDLKRTAEELKEATLPMQRKAFAERLHSLLSDSSTNPLYLLRPLIGYSHATDLASRLGWDWNKFKVPTARQFASALKSWPEADSRELQEPLARLCFRTNGKRMVKKS